MFGQYFHRRIFANDNHAQEHFAFIIFPEGSVEAPTPESEPSTRRSWMDRMWERVLRVLYSIMDDFTDLPPEEPRGDPEGDPLTVKK